MSAIPNHSRRSFLAGAATLLAGCAFPMAAGGPAVEAPSYRVGDRWTYRARDGFRVAVTWDEIQEVTAVAPDGIRVRITQAGPSVSTARVEEWPSPGLVRVGAVFDAETRRFAQPLERFQFPLAPGHTWNQWVRNFNEDTKKEGEINRYGRVIGWGKVSTPAGTYDAILVNVIMRLDDEEFWRRPTQCSYLVAYAPAVRGVVRESKEAEYWEKSDPNDGMTAIRSQHALVELVSFTPGA